MSWLDFNILPVLSESIIVVWRIFKYQATVCLQHIGNSYRGWVETEAELDYLLSCYKQATGTYWGTRQSPSPSQKTTRLMWKSQYVPFDGIPFINIGKSLSVFSGFKLPNFKHHFVLCCVALSKQKQYCICDYWSSSVWFCIGQCWSFVIYIYIYW